MLCNCEDAGCFTDLYFKWKSTDGLRESSDSSEGGGKLLRREVDVLVVEALFPTGIIVEVVN